MNVVELQGKIQNIYTGRNVTIVTLFIKGANNNFPQVVFNASERGLVENYKKNDFVNIVGSIKVRGKRTEDGKLYFEQFIRGYLICPIGNEMSEKFKMKLGGDYEYKNEVLLNGTITSVNEKNGILNFLVLPEDEKFNVLAFNYVSNLDRIKSKFTVGTNVCMKCEIQTARKEKENQKAKFFQHLVIKYMSIPSEDTDFITELYL